MFLAVPAKSRGVLSFWRDGLILLMAALFAAFVFTSPGIAKPKFAAIAVDARTGKVLFARDADGLRHPASLTKVMTLYVLFQDLKAGRIKLSTKLRVSKRAANMEPSKLGLKAGQTITVENAIKALVTKSANDVAAAIGENLGGTEAAFAIRMTKTARSIGMTRTVFKNASGLPHPAQVTTARDYAVLSLRIQRDFPEYYPYFRISSFRYGGKTIRTHNKLLGRYAGTDGIKTGYIRASGFNLTTSAKRGDKRVVGVVLGARSGGARNAYMMAMLDQVWGQCKGGKGIAANIGGKGAPVAVAEEAPKKKRKKALFGASKPETPDPVMSLGEDDQSAAEPPADAPGQTFAAVSADGEDEAEDAPAVPEKLPFAVKNEGSSTEGGEVVVEREAMPEGNGQDSWVIQVGAFPTEKSALDRLAIAQTQGGTILNGKRGYTVEVEDGAKRLYRARFAGFDRKSANSACKKLGTKGISCQAYAPQS